MGISFDTSSHAAEQIEKAAERAMDLASAQGTPYDFSYMDLIMDLTACHANGCPLDLDRLLTFPDGDFGHDVFGIARYLDRKTGELTNCFLPRCARPEVDSL